MSQIQLFESEPELPEGFVYKPELISQEEEQALVRAIEQLEFANVKMRDVVAKPDQLGFRIDAGHFHVQPANVFEKIVGRERQITFARTHIDEPD